MADIDSIRDWHLELCIVLDSLESIMHLAEDENRQAYLAAQPSLILFRQLLDRGCQMGLAR